MGGDRALAAWLIARRPEIEGVMNARLGPAAPGPGAVETEVLRRFRSFAAAALQRGVAHPPALDGLRANERRVTALLTAWCDTAAELAGEGGLRVSESLTPLVAKFRTSLRTTGPSRRARGAPRLSRRAVTAAIDRVSDAYIAVDADSGQIADANPAAGALLGVARDALLGVDAMAFVPADAHQSWWTQLDALTEGSDSRRFSADLKDHSGSTVAVDCTITRFATRNRTLALIVARPV